MQKFVQTAMFYLLVSVLIMMAGIIFGYLWSSDIGQWIHEVYNSDSVSVSTVFTVIGGFFTALTFGLAIKAYNQWRKPFAVDRLIAIHDRLIEASALIPKLIETLYEAKNKNSKKSEFELKKNIIFHAMNIESIISSAVPLALCLREPKMAAELRLSLQSISLNEAVDNIRKKEDLSAAADDFIQYAGNEFYNLIIEERKKIDRFIMDEYK